MNKKRLNSVLLVVMAGIWIALGYKLVLYFSNKNIPIATIPYNETLANNNTKTRDTFNIKTIKRDPFLGKVTPVRKKTSKNIATSTTRNNTIKTTHEPWPMIAYYGFVKNENSKEPLVLIKVNNSLKKVRKGNWVDELLIAKIYKDSIAIKKGKEERIFKKK